MLEANLPLFYTGFDKDHVNRLKTRAVSAENERQNVSYVDGGSEKRRISREKLRLAVRIY